MAVLGLLLLLALGLMAEQPMELFVPDKGFFSFLLLVTNFSIISAFADMEGSTIVIRSE